MGRIVPAKPEWWRVEEPRGGRPISYEAIGASRAGELAPGET